MLNICAIVERQFYCKPGAWSRDPCPKLRTDHLAHVPDAVSRKKLASGSGSA